MRIAISRLLQIISLTIICISLSNCRNDLSHSKKSVDAIEVFNINSKLFDEIKLLKDSTLENGIFNRVIFNRSNKTVFEIYDVDAYDTIDNSVLKGVKNEVESKHVLIQNLGGKYFISLLGAAYGCCPRVLTVIQADSEGLRIIFKDEYEISQIIEDDKGEIKYFGIESFSEPLDPIDSLDILLFTYNPTLIYDLKSEFKLDSALTQKYNEDYYVFAGFNYEGEIKVAFPRGEEQRNSGKKQPYLYK